MSISNMRIFFYHSKCEPHVLAFRSHYLMDEDSILWIDFKSKFRDLHNEAGLYRTRQKHVPRLKHKNTSVVYFCLCFISRKMFPNSYKRHNTAMCGRFSRELIWFWFSFSDIHMLHWIGFLFPAASFAAFLYIKHCLSNNLWFTRTNTLAKIKDDDGNDMASNKKWCTIHIYSMCIFCQQMW